MAIAVAAAGLRSLDDAEIKTIAVSSVDGDAAAQQTAEALAAKLGASIVELGRPDIDLIVVGSQPGASSRRISLSGAIRTALNTAPGGSVLVVPSGDPVRL